MKKIKTATQKAMLPPVPMGGKLAPKPSMPKLGTGQRFAALKAKLANKPGITNPGALAASIGRKKFGKKKFAKLSAMGKKKK